MNMIKTSFGPSPTFLSLTDGPPSPAKFFYECERSVSDASIKLARRVPFSPDVFKLIGPTLEDVIGADILKSAKAEGKRKGLPPSVATTAEKYEEETQSNPNEADDFLAVVPVGWTEQRIVIDRGPVCKSKALKIIAALEHRGDLVKHIGPRHDGKGGVIAYIRKAPVYPKNCLLFEYLNDDWQLVADLCEQAGIDERFKASQARKLTAHPDVESKSVRLAGQGGIRRGFRKARP